MSSLRSSVRPKSSKQPWGTVLTPEFGMGHQKMTDYEVDQTVNRLYYIPNYRERVYDGPETKQMTKKQINEMVSSVLRYKEDKIQIKFSHNNYWSITNIK